MKKLFEMLLGPKKTHAHFMEQGAQSLENGQRTEAERHYVRALEIAEEAKAHTAIAQISLQLARINEQNDKLAVAETHYRRAYTTHEESEEFEDAGKCLVLLGRLYYKQRRYPDAEKVLEYAMAIYQSQFGSHYQGIAEAAVALADCLMGRNMFAEAEKLLLRASSIDQDAKGPDSPVVAEELHKLAVCCDKQNKDGDAEYNFKRAVAIYEKHNSSLTRELAHQVCACYHDFGRHCLKVGKNGEAKPLLERASQLCESHPGYLDEADLAEKTAAMNV